MTMLRDLFLLILLVGILSYFKVSDVVIVGVAGAFLFHLTKF